MNSDQKRQRRITILYKKAITGKFTWKDLRAAARATGASEPTVKSYLVAVEAMMIKSGHLRKKNS